MSEVSQIHKTFAEFGGNLNNDETLVSSARSGCDAAFVELWRRHSSTVFRAVYRIVKNREDAEDISQETFLKAFAHLQGFNGASKFSTWLVRIGINTALEELRRRRSRPEASFNNMDGDEYEWQRDIPDETINIETQLMKSEMITRMNMAIDRLNPALRVVIEMHHQHDYSQIEIATRTNLSVAAGEVSTIPSKTSTVRLIYLKNISLTEDNSNSYQQWVANIFKLHKKPLIVLIHNTAFTIGTV